MNIIYSPAQAINCEFLHLSAVRGPYSILAKSGWGVETSHGRPAVRAAVSRQQWREGMLYTQHWNVDISKLFGWRRSPATTVLQALQAGNEVILSIDAL